MSGDLSGWEEGAAVGIWWAEVRDVAEPPAVPTTAFMTKNHPIPHQESCSKNPAVKASTNFYRTLSITNQHETFWF